MLAVRRVGHPRLLERLEHRGAEAAGHDALLERDDELLAARLVEDQLAVERLGEPRVEHADRPALAPRARRRPRAPASVIGPKRDEQEVAALAQHLAPADRQDLAARAPGTPNPASRG